MSSYILEIFCSSKHPSSSVNFFCFSHLKKKRSHIKNFSNGIGRYILGLQYDKIAQNGNTISLKLTKICNPHSLHASMRSADYQITTLLKFLIITRIIYTNVLTIIQSKSLPVFELWHHWTVWTPSFQTSPSGVYDCISLYNSLLINLRLLTFLYGYIYIGDI